MVTTAKRRRPNRQTRIIAEIIFILLLLVAFGFTVGRVTAPVKTETITRTKTVEVPTYEQDKLPELSEITYYDVPLSHSLQRYIYEVCADENVPVALILAMIEHESRFNPEAVSKTNDYGLMQINEINYSSLEEKYRCADMLDSYQNVFCGIKIISSCLENNDGDIVKALMCYNMGSYGASKAWEDGINSTSYTKAVMALMEEYEGGENDGRADNSDNPLSECIVDAPCRYDCNPHCRNIKKGDFQ